MEAALLASESIGIIQQVYSFYHQTPHNSTHRKGNNEIRKNENLVLLASADCAEEATVVEKFFF